MLIEQVSSNIIRIVSEIVFVTNYCGVIDRHQLLIDILLLIFVVSLSEFVNLLQI